MSLNKDIEKLNDLYLDLSSQASSLTSTMLANEEESISNLKKEIETAADELEKGIKDLKGYVSKMETQKKFWS